MADNKEENYKTGFIVWLTLCLALCVWFLSSFIKGRRQFQTNLHVIEEGLRRMQDEIEQRQRQRSISYGEDIQEITDLLKNTNSAEPNIEKQEGSQLDESSEKIQEGDKCKPEEEDDKKNV